MPLLEIQQISKEFTGTRALRDVSFALGAGEVVGLIGENGAGKSTLIKILAGVHQPDSGRIRWNGAEIHFKNPHAAITAGIATIHQELAYFEKLTVAENLLLGEVWPRAPWGGVDWAQLNRVASDRLLACELKLDPAQLFQSLSPAQRQEVAIARALSQNARLAILDEPTASLTEPEVERLIAHLGRLRKGGVAILYVSHRLDEILKLTDRVLVLRDGALAAEYPTADASIGRMVRDMVGRELAAATRRAGAPGSEVTFQASGLTRLPLFENVTLQVRRGEILGLAGLVGAGRSEFARAVYGLYPPEAGTMSLCGHSYRPATAADARQARVAYLPEERKRQGLVLSHSVHSTVSLALIEKLGRWGWISDARERLSTRNAVSRFQIKTKNPEQPIGTLSGGNQQKALLARWLETDPFFIILDEPTRGVDVGAKAEIHRLIGELADQGKAILLISSDLPELLALSDRIVVLHRGRNAAEFPAASATQEQILLAASGLAPQAAAAQHGRQVAPLLGVKKV